jgi:two-component system sensor histidine kinase QseC
LAKSASARKGALPWQDGGTATQPKYYDAALPDGERGRVVALTFAIETGEERDPTQEPIRLRVIEAVDRTELSASLRRVLGAIAGSGAVLIIGIFWIVPQVLATGLSPLRAMGAQAEKIDAYSLAARFPREDLPDELQPIGQRLNDLLSRLQASFERERRFSADLAHELRTPLAELRNLAEYALKWPEAHDQNFDREVLAIALQMEALTTRMLTLARGEHGQIAVKFTPVDVQAVVAESWKPYAGRAQSRDLHVSFNLAPCILNADAVLLRSILSNLFDNACDYAPPGGDIHVTGEVGAGYILRVSNPGVALSEEDVAQFFDRFWRKEAARSGGEHSGLGLGLARMFAAAMGWTLGASLKEGRVVFTLAECGRGF